jgi:hypothetical protein
VSAPWHHEGVKKVAKPRSKPTVATKRAAAARKKAPAGKKAPARKMAPRADLGAPIDGFFARQPAPLRPILEELRKLAEEVAPDASSAIKWGMPFYTIGGNTMCALGAHKAHVNLILAGPPGTFADPDQLLQGEGKTGKHLKLRPGDAVPRAAIRAWLRTAATLARKPA